MAYHCKLFDCLQNLLNAIVLWSGKGLAGLKLPRVTGPTKTYFTSLRNREDGRKGMGR